VTPMDHDHIEEHQVVDRYLMNQLSDEEAARFEEHYLGCQQCLDQLELAESLQRGLKRAVVEGATAVVAAHQLGILAWIARMPRAARAGLVVALLAVVLGPVAYLTRELRHTSWQLRDALAPQAGTSVVSIGPSRGLPAGGIDGSPTHVIRLSARPEWVVLSLELGEREQESFRVVLYRGEREIWRQDGVRPDARDDLTLSLHSTWLEAGDHVVRVEAVAPGGETVPAARFPFRVVRGD